MAIVLFLLLSPGPLRAARGVSFYRGLFPVTEPSWEGTLTLYHIVTERSYQGSVTWFLSEQAKAFEKQNRGIHIQVTGMDAAEYAERRSAGRLPDAYSFFAGALHEGQLQPFSLPTPTLRPGLRAIDCALPYLFSCSVLLTGDGRKETAPADYMTNGRLEIDPFSAARLGLNGTPAAPGSLAQGRADAAYLDLRALGDITRSEGLISQAITCPDAFTTAVCYLGVARGTDPVRAEKLGLFFSWLLESGAQAELAALGAFCVRADVKQVFASNVLSKVNESYVAVATVDPILWAAHREALLQDAALCPEGDEHAKARFLQRLELVLLN